jgi:hypothetical protein
LAAARAAEADEAAKKPDQVRIAAVTSREAAQAMMLVRVAEHLKRRAEEADRRRDLPTVTNRTSPAPRNHRQHTMDQQCSLAVQDGDHVTLVLFAGAAAQVLPV